MVIKCLLNRVGSIDERLQLMEIQVAVGIIRPFCNFGCVLHVLLFGGDSSDHRSHGGDLGGRQVDVSFKAKTMREITFLGFTKTQSKQWLDKT